MNEFIAAGLTILLIAAALYIIIVILWINDGDHIRDALVTALIPTGIGIGILIVVTAAVLGISKIWEGIS